MAITLSDIQLLSDSDLYEQLHEYEPNIGPVVDSTRSVYQSMLFTKLTEANNAHNYDGGNVESVPSDTEQKITKPPEQQPLRSSPHTFKRWNDVDDPFASQRFDDAVSFRSRASVTPRHPISMYDSRFPPPVNKGGSAIKTVLLLGFVFFVATAIIFVVTQSGDPYHNIETEANKATDEDALKI